MPRRNRKQQRPNAGRLPARHEQVDEEVEEENWCLQKTITNGDCVGIIVAITSLIWVAVVCLGLIAWEINRNNEVKQKLVLAVQKEQNQITYGWVFGSAVCILLIGPVFFA